MEGCHAAVLNSDAQLSTCPFVYGTKGKADNAFDIYDKHLYTRSTRW